MFQRLKIRFEFTDSDADEADRAHEMTFDFTGVSDAAARVALHSFFFNACTSCIDLCTPEANARLRAFLARRNVQASS